jgi:hypothetical protein
MKYKASSVNLDPLALALENTKKFTSDACMVILVACRSSLNVLSTMDGSGSSKVRVIYPPASMPAIILPFTLSVSMFIGKILYVHSRHMGTRQVSGTTMI